MITCCIAFRNFTTDFQFSASSRNLARLLDVIQSLLSQFDLFWLVLAPDSFITLFTRGGCQSAPYSSIFLGRYTMWLPGWRLNRFCQECQASSSLEQLFLCSRIGSLRYTPISPTITTSTIYFYVPGHGRLCAGKLTTKMVPLVSKCWLPKGIPGGY